MLTKFKLYLESTKITPVSWLLGVSGVLMVRFFLESLSNPTSSGFFASDSSTLIHYYLFFLSVFFAFMILFQYAIPSWKNVSSQFVAVISPVIFMAPIIDWIVSKGKGFKMVYFFNTPREILSSFFHLGASETTIGLRIEIILILVFFGGLVYFVQRDWFRAVISALLLYTAIFVFASIPTIITIVGQVGHLFQNDPLVFLQNTIANSATVSNNIHGSLEYSSFIRLFEISFNFIMGKILFLILIFLSFFWFFTNFRKKFKAIFFNSRFERVSHYLVMIVLGVLTAYSMFPEVNFNWNDWLSIIVLFFSFYFSIMFAICINDNEDEKIDAISNTNRPLITGSLCKDDMKQMAFIFFIACLISGFLAGYTAFFFVLTFTALYYIYSALPTRYKFVPFFSSFLIGLCALTAVMAGFFLFSPLKQVSIFPDKFILAVVILFFLGSHIRDLKDVKGDKTAGIKTVPVIFGEKWGPKVVGLMSSMAYLLVPIFLNIFELFMIAAPAALVNYYFCTKKPYSEKPIFGLYFLFVSFLFLFV